MRQQQFIPMGALRDDLDLPPAARLVRALCHVAARAVCEAVCTGAIHPEAMPDAMADEIDRLLSEPHVSAVLADIEATDDPGAFMAQLLTAVRAERTRRGARRVN